MTKKKKKKKKKKAKGASRNSRSVNNPESRQPNSRIPRRIRGPRLQSSAKPVGGGTANRTVRFKTGGCFGQKRTDNSPKPLCRGEGPLMGGGRENERLNKTRRRKERGGARRYTYIFVRRATSTLEKEVLGGGKMGGELAANRQHQMQLRTPALIWKTPTGGRGNGGGGFEQGGGKGRGGGWLRSMY